MLETTLLAGQIVEAWLRPRISFTVYGIPGPQGSKRHVGDGRMIESSKKVAPWREAVKWAAIGARNGATPFDGPLEVTLNFTLPRPASAPKRVLHPFRNPDLDKLIRSTFDALTDSGIWADDARVVRLSACKEFVGLYSDTPGVYIAIEPIT